MASFSVILNGKNSIVSKVSADTERLKKPLRIKAQDQVNYQLQDDLTGKAPDVLSIKRVGKDMWLNVEAGDIKNPNIIIENYFSYPGRLIGQAESNSFYEFVPEVANDGSVSGQLGINPRKRS